MRRCDCCSKRRRSGGFARRIEAVARGPRGAVTRIEPARRDDAEQLSFAEQRLWFLAQLEPDSTQYHIPMAIRWRGPLDAVALERSVNALVARHESLRTTYATRDDHGARVVAPSLTLRMPVVDLSALDEAEREVEIRRLANAHAEALFDLERGPLVRLSLLRSGPDDHVLLVVIHHIVSDGWSAGVWSRDLARFYEAFTTNTEPVLAPLEIQYADFAARQRAWLTGPVLDEQLAYWKRQLAGAPSLIDLPTDRPRPAVQTYHGAHASFRLSASATAALHALGRRESATLFMTLLAAFQVLLHRYSRQDDISVGSPVANRNREETENLIGFFVNTLVLRTDLSGDPSFRELLARVREVALGAYSYQDLPFEKVVEAIDPERSLAHAPLFQVMFSLQNAPGGSAMPGLEQTDLEIESRTSKFDLLLDMFEDAGTLHGTIEYKTDLFDAATIERMVGHFERLLAGIVANPQQRISELPLLSEPERHQLVVEWNDTARAYPHDGWIHERFAAQAAATPTRTALVFEGESLTYAELDARANQLARHLQGLGVGPETLVGVMLERSLEMVISLFAILKAGGAYVPFDPSYPPDRLAYMIEDARARIVITPDWLAASAHEISRQPTDALEVALAPNHLAYVIYTSGSTGRPKGAMNTHAGIANRLRWMQAQYQLGADDRVLQKTPFSFDVSVWEFFWPLMVGARLVIAKPGGHQDPSYLVDTIAREGITTLHFVPPMLAVFLETADVARCTSLRCVVSSGEALAYELVVRFHERLHAKLHNLYGPTEAAVDVSHWTCEPDGPPVVPIGYPIANLRLHVLDTHYAPVPRGAAGEIHLAGIGLGRGYLDRPALTAERFVPDPFSPEPGGRLYRTGDLGRVRADGAIEYLGRIDHQVKIRGFRIELGEIEAQIAAHPSVRECVVLVREDSPGDKRLVAYLVGGDVAAVRARLATKLPDYMVPSAFVVLDALPLTPNGKIDRKALPAPDRQVSGKPFVATTTPAQGQVAAIWATVLGVERVGADDNFFELGGHSLLATQVISRVRQAFQIELPLRTLFEAPTVAAFAGKIDTVERDAVSTAARIAPIARDGALPLSFAEERQWFLEQLEPGIAAVQHRRCGAAARRARRRGARAQPGDRGAAPRSAAHDVRDARPSLRARDRAGARGAHHDRRRGRRARARGRGARGRAVRSRARAAVAHARRADRERRARAAVCRPSHHLRRVVDRCVLARAVRVLSRAVGGWRAGLAGARDPVRGLRGVAAHVAVGRRARRAARVLETTARGVAELARAADGSTAAHGAELRRRDDRLRAAGAARAWRARARARHIGDRVHHAARGISDAAASL